MKKRLFAMVMLLIMCVSLTAVPAFATEGDTNEPDSNAAVGGGVAQTDPILTDPSTNTTDTPDTSTDSGGYYGNIPSPDEAIGVAGQDVVTTTDVENWVNRKGGEIINIIELAVRWISVFFFFVSLVLVVIGAVGNKRTMVAGFIGMAICCVIFAVATCGTQIMNIVSAWLRS